MHEVLHCLLLCISDSPGVYYFLVPRELAAGVEIIDPAACTKASTWFASRFFLSPNKAHCDLQHKQPGVSLILSSHQSALAEFPLPKIFLFAPWNSQWPHNIFQLPDQWFGTAVLSYSQFELLMFSSSDFFFTWKDSSLECKLHSWHHQWWRIHMYVWWQGYSTITVTGKG